MPAFEPLLRRRFFWLTAISTASMEFLVKHSLRVRQRVAVLPIVMAWVLAGVLPLAALESVFAGQLIGLGDLPGGATSSRANAISADGNVVVGVGTSAWGTEGFRWTMSGGMTGLGDLTGGSFYSTASDVSADGSVIVGQSWSTGGYEGFRWTQGGGMAGLGDLPGGAYSSSAHGVSLDGSVIVGVSHGTLGWSCDFWGCNPINNDGAFRWTSGSGMTYIGELPGGAPQSVAFDTTNSIAVGQSVSASGAEAAMWDSGLIYSLGDLPGGAFGSAAYKISADGSIIVGHGTSALGTEAARWASGGVTGLGDLPSGIFYSVAYGMSADGSVIVGTSATSAGYEAFIWDETNGMQRLADILIQQGADLTGWSLLNYAFDVSSDGNSIVGYGQHNGVQEAFFANLSAVPVPTAVWLFGSGLAGLFGLARRRARPA